MQAWPLCPRALRQPYPTSRMWRHVQVATSSMGGARKHAHVEARASGDFGHGRIWAEPANLTKRDTSASYIDDGFKNVQLSRLHRNDDPTSSGLHNVLHKWAAAQPTDQQSYVVVCSATLRRFGATPCVLEALGDTAPPTVDEVAATVSNAAVNQWKMGRQPCTDAYFPSTAGLHRGNAAFRLVDRHPWLRPHVEEHLRTSYEELAAGSGRWCSLDRSVGPSALLARFPGGRRRVQNVQELMSHNASFTEVDEVL